MPGGPTTTELKVGPKGDLENANGSMPLPMLGDLSMLVIEPLPEEKVGQWDDVKKIALNETHTSGGTSSPFRFGRPTLRERMMESRLPGRFGSRLRPGSPFGTRPGQRGPRMPAPQPQQVQVITHPAQERSEFVLGTESGSTVSIAKTYELSTDEKVGDEPRVLMTGQGTITFDVKAGVPTAMEFKARVTENADNITLRIPIEVSCKLLEGQEREHAMRFPVIPPLVMNPLKDADVRAALADLKTTDSGKRTRAANRLRDAAPIESLRTDVSKALESLLDDRDGFFKSAVIQALGVWGDHDAVPLLITRLNDESYGSRGELFEALGRQPDERTAQAMTAWLAKETGQAVRILRALGPAAEPAVLDFVTSSAEARLRVEACRVLKDVGTSRSVPVLQKLTAQKDSEQLGRVAEGVARVIANRFPKDAELTVALEGLESTDVAVRRAAAHSLLAASPVASRRAAVAQALVKHLGEPDNEAQRIVILALGNWGDTAAAQALTEKLKDHAFLPWRAATESLGKLAKDRAAAEAIALWLKDDRGLVFRSLQAMGPPAEPVLIAIVQSKEDWGVRSEACKLLGVIGSQASIPVLQEAGKDRNDAFVVMAAESSLKLLAPPSITSAAASVAIDSLKSGDVNRVRAAAQSLAAAKPDPKTRADIANALLAALGGNDDLSQRDVLRALKVWGDKDVAQALLARGNDNAFRMWREALDTAATLEPTAKTAEALIARMPDDFGHVLRLLREIGPPAEPAVLHAFQTASDVRVRVESCKVLETIATPASLTVLQEAAAKTGEGTLAIVAEDSLKGIAERE
jgi:HEAT repeat protein